MAKRKRYTFRLTLGEDCDGNPMWHCGVDYHFDGKWGGSGWGCRTKEEALRTLYHYQDRDAIASKDIDWQGIAPRELVEQLKLFEV